MLIREYLKEGDQSPYADWFNSLNSQYAVEVRTALARMETGNLGNTKPLKGRGGLFEYVLNFGPGIRVYCGRDGDKIILLGGGTKKRQQKDIELAEARWKDYKQRRK